MRTLAAIALLLLAIPASASIAVFADGRNTKIEAYEVEEEMIHLTLQGGGKLSLPITRIERIVDDEIVPVEVVEEVKKIVEEQGGVFPKRSWRYSERSQPLWQSKYNDIIVAAAQKTSEISLPVAITVFPEDVYRPPETWARRAYKNLIYFNEVDKGGHFAAWEQPELFASELRPAFRTLREAQ